MDDKNKIIYESIQQAFDEVFLNAFIENEDYEAAAVITKLNEEGGS